MYSVQLVAQPVAAETSDNAQQAAASRVERRPSGAADALNL